MNKNDLSTLKKNKETLSAKNNSLKPSKKKSSSTWKIFIFILIIIIIISTLLSLHFYANKKVSDNLKSTLRLIKSDCYVTYGSSLYRLWNNSLDIRDIVVECRSVTVATIGLMNINKIIIDGSSISDFEAVIKNGVLSFESPLYGAIGRRAKQLGYFDARFDGNLSFDYNNLTKLLTISDLTLDFNDIANIKLNLTVPNISSADFSTTLKEIINNNYETLNIDFTNTGIISKVLKNYIENKGYNIIQAKEATLNAIERRMLYTSNMSSNEYLHMKAIYDFINYSNVLSIKSNSKNNASLSAILDSIKSNRYSELFRSFTNLPLTIKTY